MAKMLLKGNEAIVKGAILAGCRAYYGYPITPASEIAEAAALYFPRVGGTFLQAESEVAAINMVYGAASAGIRCMTASSGPGISLKQEGISYLAGAELPCVIVDIMRGGPGLGNIAPEQGDYNQIVKGGGHGSYQCIVLAPNSAQEMCDLTVLAFDLADKYRNPVYRPGRRLHRTDDGARATSRRPGPASLPSRGRCDADGTSKDNLISSIYLEPDDLEGHVNKLDGEVQGDRADEVRLRDVPTRRRRVRRRRLRHRRRGAEDRGRHGAGWRHQGRSAPADHALAVPEGEARRAGRPGPAASSSSSSRRADGRRRAPRREREEARSASTAARGGMSRPPSELVDQIREAGGAPMSEKSLRQGGVRSTRLRAQVRTGQAEHPLLPRLRPRQSPQADRRGDRRPRHRRTG